MKALLRRAWAAIERFAFAPARAEPLAVLRIGLGLVLLAQAAMIAPIYLELYGGPGALAPPIRDALQRPSLPDVHWLMAQMSRWGVAETSTLLAVAALYLLSVTALCLGLFTRTAAAVALLVHIALETAARGTSYGADQFGHLFLFYLVFLPSGAAISLDRRLGRVPAGPSWQARLGLRVIQLHLCMVYLATAAAKAMGTQWRDGEAIWRSLMLPEYRQLDFSWLAAHPHVAVALGWAVLLTEIGYPVLIWPRRTRRLWVAFAVGMHLAIAAFLGLYVFGVMMAWLTLAAFGVRADPAPESGRSLHVRLYLRGLFASHAER